ncbi:MAG TPA: glycosyltransferase family 2 protein [Anaerolineales bacterium]
MDEMTQGLEISAIIPTYNRPDDLQECLQSILDQTVRPSEVVVVDNGDSGVGRTQEVVEQMEGTLAAAGILVRYIQNRRQNSLTTARNLGIDFSRGSIISFLDDDVVLDPRYYEAILEVYRTHPQALGVEGLVVGDGRRNPIAFGLEQILGRVFYLGFREQARCRVLPSLGVTYPLTEELVTCEWLSGACATYRRHVFNDFRPDEKLRKYADNEDLDLSYGVFKKFPGTLWLTPQAKCHHKTSAQGRITGRERVYMQEVYRYYLFHKHIAITPKNLCIYIWSRVGRVVYLLVRSAVRLSPVDLQEAGHLPGAWALCVRHHSQSRRGDLTFFDQFLS